MRKKIKGYGEKRIGKKEAAFLALMHGGMGTPKKSDPQEDRPVCDIFDDETKV